MGRRGGRQGSGRLGDLLRRYRQRLGLSQEELAERVTPALSVASIGNIERGRTRLYRRALLSLPAPLRKGPSRRKMYTAYVEAPRGVGIGYWG